jgi:hypothetical protein
VQRPIYHSAHKLGGRRLRRKTVAEAFQQFCRQFGSAALSIEGTQQVLLRFPLSRQLRRVVGKLFLHLGWVEGEIPQSGVIELRFNG